MTDAPILVEVERSGMVESRHHGHVAVVDDTGAVLRSAGDPELVVYPRSALKPLQAVAMLQAGLDFTGAWLALSAASHSGEPFHAEAVAQMLAASDLDADALQCPPDLPYGEAARNEHLAAGGGKERILMNCSGKHAAMLRTCVLNGWSTDDYLRPDHPLQVHLRASVGEQVGSELEPVSTDGCGAPLWGLPLAALARGFAALPATEQGQAVAAAIQAHPEYSGGTDRDVTTLIRGVPGLVAKDGAEAVQAMMLSTPEANLGIVLKIEDGGQRARPVAAAGVLHALGVDAPVIAEQMRVPVLGGGEPVGAIRPVAGVI